MSSQSSKAKGKRRASPGPARRDIEDDEVVDPKDELEFEDEYGDEFEEEIYEPGEDGEEDAAEAMESEMAAAEDGVNVEVDGRLYRAGDAMAADERLDYDSSAYDMIHRLHMEWPCLSFAFAKDGLGERRETYPMTAFAVAGTQAESSGQNKLICAKMSQMARTKHDDDSDDDDDDDDDAIDDDPIVQAQMVDHEGTVNRLRLMPQSANICATWSDTGKVHIYNLAAQLSNLASPGSAGTAAVEAGGKPVFTFAGHKDEGYALDFSPAKPGMLASGDCANALHVWQPRDGGASWSVDPQPYTGHTASVEDVAWSPVEANVLMSCGCDSTVRVWDTRKKGGSALCVDEGHKTDVNVLSWNKMVNYLVVSGADDGSFRVWDLRTFRSGEPVARFHWHRKQITSVEWCPDESSSIAVTGADNQTTLWDLALEADPDADGAHVGRDDLQDLPPQLYFVHQGQSDLKEVHWHPQMPGVLGTTAGDSFHMWKPANHGDGNVHET